MPLLLARCLPRVCVPRKKRKSLTICEPQPSGTRHHHQVEVNKLFVRRVESIRVTQKAAAAKRPPLPPPTERHHHHHNQQQNKKTKSKAPVHGSHGPFRSKENVDKLTKPDDTELDCETHISDRRSRHTHRTKSKLSHKVHANKKQSTRRKKSKSEANEEKSPNPPTERNHLAQLFNKTKVKTRPPSPESSSVIDVHEGEDEDNLEDTTGSTSSSLSSDWSTTTYPDSHSSKKSDDPIELVQRRQSMPVPLTTNPSLDEIKHRSCVGSFYLGREHVPQPTPPIPSLSMSKIHEEKEKSNVDLLQQHRKTSSNNAKPPAKSKQVLQNVRKMIKDQHVQQQHFNDTRQRESVRL